MIIAVIIGKWKAINAVCFHCRLQ